MNTRDDGVQAQVIGGIDTHRATHHAVALNGLGLVLGDKEFPATTAGYRDLLEWMSSYGVVSRIGVESTGSYGAGLTRYLTAHDVRVIEINQPHAHTRLRIGKSDPIDAEAAARKVLDGALAIQPKRTTGVIEAIRILRVARESAVKARSAALVQFQDLVTTAPAELRESLTRQGTRANATLASSWRPDATQLNNPAIATKMALRAIARRVRALDDEIKAVDEQLSRLVAQVAPTLITRLGIGTQHAAQLLVTAGENIDRLTSEAAFARLCGVAPIPASSGQTHRMRLHRGGDRQANRTLHLIAVCRLRYDQRTIDYMTRRQAEGLSKKDVIRCLKRFIAREVFHDLVNDLGR
ncbi:MAG: IS110 family transposase [Actinomycetota bacterium]|nr:IS110 family transposase [Actinomycetota bacterium]